MEKTRLHIPDFPSDLHREVKVEAARLGVTMKKYVIEALRKHLETTTVCKGDA